MKPLYYFGVIVAMFFCSSFAQQQPNEEKIIIREVVAKDGAKVSINVDSFEHSMFKISGEGFKPYESLNFISNSCEEIICFQVEADENGNIFPIGMLPAIIGKSGGICYIDILRKEDSVHLKFPWGTENIKK